MLPLRASARQLRLRLADGGDEVRIVDRRQEIAFGDPLAGRDRNLRKPAVDFGRDADLGLPHHAGDRSRRRRRKLQAEGKDSGEPRARDRDGYYPDAPAHRVPSPLAQDAETRQASRP